MKNSDNGKKHDDNGKKHDIDAEIEQTERRIAERYERLRWKRQVLTRTFRIRMTSPQYLIGAAVTGYVFGLLSSTRRGERASPLRRLWGVAAELASTVLKFAQTGPAVFVASAIGAAKATKPGQGPDQRAAY